MEYENKILSVINDFYDLGKINAMKQMKNGIGSNSFHIISEKGDFIFKDIEKNYMNYPENEASILRVLKEDGLPVPEIIISKSGEEFLNIDNRSFHLQSFMEGMIYVHNTAPDWLLYDSAKMLGKITKAMKKLDKLPEGIGENFFKYVTPDNALKSHKNTLKRAMDNSHDEIVYYQKSKLKLIEKWKDINFNLRKMTCVNTHGDYSINQILCKDNKISAVIDFTSACVHPIAWEVFRSYSLGDKYCLNGSINVDNLKRYINYFSEYSNLNEYDLEIMPYLYFYQILISDYYGQYYESKYSNKFILLENAKMASKQCIWLDKNISKISL